MSKLKTNSSKTSNVKAATSSRPKLAKIETKRGAPVHNAVPQYLGGAGGWIIGPEPSVLGMELLKQINRAVNTHIILDENNSPKRSERAADAASDFRDALAYVPPKGAIEALAAAILIYSDLDLVENGGTEGTRYVARERIAMRTVALAQWIEDTHKIDRRAYRLDYFCDGEAHDRLIPHAAASLNVYAEHDK